MDTTPVWFATKVPRFPRLSASIEVDVAVIGGGITGVTAAYLLKKAGLTVALLERERFASVDTGHTTAHVTFVTDLRLPQLVKHFGRDHARAAWEAGDAAIHQIREIVERESIDCEFAWVPGYVHAPLGENSRNEEKPLRDEAELARELGFAAQFEASIPLMGSPGIRFANQAKFHPLKYLAALLRLIPGNGSHVFQDSGVEEIEEEPRQVTANGRKVRCRYVVIATHVPLQGVTGTLKAMLFQTKLAPYTSYAIGAKIPRGLVPEASFWDTAEPYHYLRIDRRRQHDYAIFGGEDHKTGQSADTAACFARLEEKLRQLIPKVVVDHRWSGQVVETNDGLPYIGETAPRQFVATGFAGNGMTFGTLGAMMACDAALGRVNPWAKLFDVRRKKLRGGTWDYLKENKDYPYYYLKDRLSGPGAKSLRSVKKGEGKIVMLDGERVAAFRDANGKLTVKSAICTHLGCIVRWNDAEQKWDCPCHGSRFHATGEVLAGPAETDLSPVKIT
jgi:glycine/D-amino acid oxidase-like deaminating enzyme/nitrite reductase/ring-hydroxylating ferredoxin subunit